MVAAVTINAPQSGVFSVYSPGETPQISVPQSVVRVVYNIPAKQIRAAAAGIMVPVRQNSSIRAVQAAVLAVVRGTISNPKLKAWSFTLDGHDFWVIKLGTDRKTLIFDLSTGQWSWWTTEASNGWRASIGLNWRSAGSIPSNYGSNVVVGDDSYGILWVLDPDSGTDQSIYDTVDDTVFSKTATGQVTEKARQTIPVYSVTLEASRGQPASTVNSVTLSYSDDQGHTFVDAGSITVVDGNYDQEFIWRSLGRIKAPGRLFRITDQGAFARIDALDINE